MNLYWSNLLAWCVQIAVVSAACAGLPWLFRLGVSRAKLWYWHVVLLICLALPLLQPWASRASGAAEVTFTTGQFHLAETPEPAHIVVSWTMVALAVLSCGIGLRLLSLGLGLLRLRRYRAAALPLEQADNCFADMRRAIAPDAEILVSGNVASPVTFGFRDPVILLPDTFAGLSREERTSIVCHELIHIRRHDWAIVIAEELVRAIFWFHPAIWWLLGRIQLTREQVVDQEVIRYTGDRNRYLDALLSIASLQLSADLAPAPLFLKKRHLRQRVESIVSGVSMTKRNLLLPVAAAFATLPVVIGIAAWQFPLRAAPQEAVDDSGVEVQLGAGKILHRTGIAYPEEARAKQISGTVVAHLTLNDKGEVTDAVAVSGPQELRKPVIQSVLNWHFSQNSGSTPEVQIAVHFDAGQRTASVGPPESAEKAAVVKELREKAAAAARQTAEEGRQSPAANIPRTIEGVNLDRLPAALRDKVEQACGVTATSTLPAEDLPALVTCLRSVDEHIRTQGYLDKGKMKLMVGIPQPAARTADAFDNPPQSIRVGGNVQANNILQKINPIYPSLAKQAHIQGTVRFNAAIGPDGLVKNLQVVSGHPMLVQAALEAVKQWVYKPTLLNGSPVEVITVIDINFTLQQ